ncbi:type I-C CRISPR-associated protein Cas5c [Psychrobacter sp. TAE2020]|uniref:type I-C CRISPR-associated protein Cas5c n=1 Tax=Psychrobacter sp. TAE2020 TaxID=2846762 RepID=UPI001C0FF893|nr:type I-C CRISPR-associated protein Cas5c [Psychrobacter sp. TAE2020]MBU5617732.1 type I-C CRISPR-associated protein Cas5c [Psychrobacter sp. TAE2020]
MLQNTKPKNSIEFLLTGRNALFTDPITRIGGEKTSYHLPTYEALKGVCKSIYWKPSIIWYIDKVRVINPIRTQTKGMKPIRYHKDGNDLAYYTYLHDVAYQVQAHFEWNMHRPELEADHIDGKHYSIAKRMVDKGGRQDIFLGARECQGYVEPCVFGSGKGAYDDTDELGYGLMFHSFAYPDETGVDELHSRFWHAVIRFGVIEFPKPTDDLQADSNNGMPNRFVRAMSAKTFTLDENIEPVTSTEESL